MNDLLRYVSVLGVVISPDRYHFLIGQRNQKDDFHPGEPVFPGGRLEGYESLEKRLLQEISEECGIQVNPATIHYLGECVFPRDNIPVTQLCFLVYAMTKELRTYTEEVRQLRWITPNDFFTAITKEGYFENYHRFVKKAISLGFLLTNPI